MAVPKTHFQQCLVALSVQLRLSGAVCGGAEADGSARGRARSAGAGLPEHRRRFAAAGRRLLCAHLHGARLPCSDRGAWRSFLSDSASRVSQRMHVPAPHLQWLHLLCLNSPTSTDRMYEVNCTVGSELPPSDAETSCAYVLKNMTTKGYSQRCTSLIFVLVPVVTNICS